MTATDLSQRYAKPPIVEAICEIRLSEPAAANKVRKSANWLKGRYADLNAEVQAEVKVDFASRSASFTDAGEIYRMTSTDQTNLCVLAPLSLAWVKRAPYDGWDSFFERLSAELPIALKGYGSNTLARVGLRYVNRIDVKLVDSLARHEDYLKFRIVHGDLLEPTNGFQWQLVKEFNDVNLKATVQSGVVEQEIPGFAGFSFDIDVYCDTSLPRNIEGILGKLTQMRDLKNRIFEAGITEQAREGYK